MRDATELFIKLGKSIKFALLTGALWSVLVTLVVTVWEWIENPGGIFHGTEGTNWNFVLETAISWLVPTLIWATIVVFAIHIMASLMRHAAANRNR